MLQLVGRFTETREVDTFHFEYVLKRLLFGRLARGIGLLAADHVISPV